MAKVAVDEYGCWLWTGATMRNGYAVIQRGRGLGTTAAHRVAYEALVGPIPAGLELDHLCRVRHCVNPAHLEPVSRSENNRRGARGVRRLVCPEGHWLLGDNVGAGDWRYCKTCRRAKAAAA
jgi:hypothetical protein